MEPDTSEHYSGSDWRRRIDVLDFGSAREREREKQRKAAVQSFAECVRNIAAGYRPDLRQ